VVVRPLPGLLPVPVGLPGQLVQPELMVLVVFRVLVVR